MLSKEQLKDPYLPYFILRNGDEHRILDGHSALSFDRKVTQKELITLSILDLEESARKELPELVGKSFVKACKVIHPASTFVVCPKSRDGVFDYDAMVKKLEASIARLKAGEHLKDKKANGSKNGKKTAVKTTDKKTTAKKTANKKDNVKTTAKTTAKKTAKKLPPKK